MRSASKLAITAGVATALTVSVAAPAFGDPPSGVTPKRNAIVGVGSDTTEYFVDQLALAYDAQSPAPKRLLFSWDATGTSPITTKVGATAIPRPNGSGSGISALINNTVATVDFARSSRGRSASDPANISFMAFGKDAVTAAVQSTTHAPKNLTTTQLRNIYTCTATQWTDVGGTSSATIQPFLPQSGSGTRAFFESAIGVTDAQIGGCVTQGVQENEGTDPGLVGNVDAIVPYSVAKYIAQVYHSGAGQNDFGSDVHGTLKLDRVNSTNPTQTLNGVVRINPNFTPTFVRTVYNVVRQDATQSDGIPAYLRVLFGRNGFLCKHASTIVANYGFLPLTGSQCGAVS